MRTTYSSWRCCVKSTIEPATSTPTTTESELQRQSRKWRCKVSKRQPKVLNHLPKIRFKIILLTMPVSQSGYLNSNFFVIPLQAQRVGRGIALLFRDTRRGWVVSSTPRPHFTPGKDPVAILQEAGWVPRPVWTEGKSRPHRDSIPDRPVRSQPLYRLSYRADKFQFYDLKNFKFVSETFLTFLWNKVLTVVPVELDLYIKASCSHSIKQRSHAHSSNSPIHCIRVSKHF